MLKLFTKLKKNFEPLKCILIGQFNILGSPLFVSKYYFFHSLIGVCSTDDKAEGMYYTISSIILVVLY